MSRGHVLQRDEAAEEDRTVARLDRDLRVPDDVLDDVPSFRGPCPDIPLTPSGSAASGRAPTT